ncbi:hypothetical protein BN1708_016102 [Verticillium longisporum]|uniref:rRNA 2'-O-methyltransferase fibrillarin n=1 Tax=Verticillium longisporum TaxID=100787 RepID=A0A0G4MDN4_VERLO|nr:hypothetical protein BN1708_016102 [Verticillium longisporum]
MYFGPGSKVLYLGGASGTSVSHVADIVGPTGFVYAVEFSPRSGRDLIGMASKRTNVVPIVEDARQPLKYRMIMPMVDCIFADVAQPDQASSRTPASSRTSSRTSVSKGSSSRSFLLSLLTTSLRFSLSMASSSFSATPPRACLRDPKSPTTRTPPNVYFLRARPFRTPAAPRPFCQWS